MTALADWSGTALALARVLDQNMFSTSHTPMTVAHPMRAGIREAAGSDKSGQVTKPTAKARKARKPLPNRRYTASRLSCPEDLELLIVRPSCSPFLHFPGPERFAPAWNPAMFINKTLGDGV